MKSKSGLCGQAMMTGRCEKMDNGVRMRTITRGDREGERAAIMNSKTSGQDRAAWKGWAVLTVEINSPQS